MIIHRYQFSLLNNDPNHYQGECPYQYDCKDDPRFKHYWFRCPNYCSSVRTLPKPIQLNLFLDDCL